VASDNLESKKLFASCGFVHTATLKEWICRKNEFKDVELYQKIMKD
jgi:RimJ/RimL family protein N-acetyltransferase